MASHEALAATIQEHRCGMLAIARRLCRDPETAQDLVHDTIVRALSRRHQLRADQSIRAWLTTILRNVFIDDLRKRRPTVVPLDETTPVAAEHPPPQPPWNRLTGADHVWAVGQLGDEYGETYRRVVLEGRPVEDVARELKLNPVTVRTRVHRARGKLREHLLALLAGRKDGEA